MFRRSAIDGRMPWSAEWPDGGSHRRACLVPRPFAQRGEEFSAGRGRRGIDRRGKDLLEVRSRCSRNHLALLTCFVIPVVVAVARVFRRGGFFQLASKPSSRSDRDELRVAGARKSAIW